MVGYGMGVRVDLHDASSEEQRQNAQHGSGCLTWAARHTHTHTHMHVPTCPAWRPDTRRTRSGSCPTPRARDTTPAHSGAAPAACEQHVSTWCTCMRVDACVYVCACMSACVTATHLGLVVVDERRRLLVVLAQAGLEDLWTVTRATCHTCMQTSALSSGRLMRGSPVTSSLPATLGGWVLTWYVRPLALWTMLPVGQGLHASVARG